MTQFAKVGPHSLALVLCLVAGLLAPATAALAVDLGSISGRVIEDHTGNAIPGAEVRVWDEAADVLAGFAVTDAAGEYTVGNLPSGTYRVVIDGGSLHYNASLSGIVVVGGVETTGVDAALSSNGSISGLVTDGRTGNPLEGVSVHVHNEDNPVYAWWGAVTGADGRYFVGGPLSGLAPGTYKVWFRVESDARYPVEWWSDKPSFSAADVVIVASGSNTIADAVLSRPSTVSGTVRDADGDPLAGIAVIAYDSTEEFRGYAATAEDGTYSFEILHQQGPLDLKVQFQAQPNGYVTEWWENQPNLDAASPIAVGLDEDIVGIDATLALGGSISGRVLFGETGTPFEEGLVDVWAFNSSGDFVGGWYADADGYYLIPGLPDGVVKVLFGIAREWDIFEWWDDKLTLETADPVTVVAGAVTPGVDSMLGGNGAGAFAYYGAGDYLSTDLGQDGATPNAPVETTITGGEGQGTVLITTAPTGQDPSGFDLLGRTVSISAPFTPSSGAPFTLEFLIDSSAAVEGTTVDDIVVFRDEQQVGGCEDQSGVASPDPCVLVRDIWGDDFHIVILTSQFSAWNFGVTANTMLATGFYSPVDMGGVWNRIQGGATVPLTFELFDGGTELTDVALVEAFTVRGVACPGSGDTIADVEFTTTGNTTLRYDAGSGRFIQNWKTPRIPGACLEVTATFTGGMKLAALFEIR